MCGRFARESVDEFQAALAFERSCGEALAEAFKRALDELEGPSIHLNQGPIGSVSEWRFVGRDAARIALDRVAAWRSLLPDQPSEDGR